MTSVEDKPTRKLAAILLADVVSYSRMMGEDEEGTLARLKAHQKEFINPTIKAFHGRIVKLMGDGILVEFPSVVEAVSCAVEIQEGMPARNRNIADSRKTQFRIGINLGDIIVDGDDLFGDGVNICARLDALAPTGGICISGAVYDSLGNKLPLDFKSLGEQKVKNIVQPVRTYSVQLLPGADLPKPGGPSLDKNEQEKKPQKEKPQNWLPIVFMGVVVAVVGLLLWLQLWQQNEKSIPTEKIALPLLEKPSIAVLPFDNMSDDPGQEYFSDGISEDIITNLSQLKNLAIIARNSSFTYKGTNTKAQDIGKDLGVKYVLEGSVRKAGDRVRITAQLVDTQNGHHLWAERFDRKLTDVFSVQDEITGRIATALSIQLSVDEQQQLGQGTAGNFEAYDLFLQGQRAFFQASETGLSRAAELYRQAINLDPEFARAYGALAVTLTRQSFLGYSDAPVESKVRALELARKAVSIDPTSPQSLWALGYVYMQRKQFDEAIETLERALSIAPNYADGYGLLALINNNIGQSEEAIRLLEKGMELNPYYTWDYLYNLGRAYYALGDYKSAAEYLEKAIERNEAVPQLRLFLASSYVQLGRQDDAEWQITELGILSSDSTLSHWRKALSVIDEDVRSRLFEDLRKAGLAE